MRWLEFRTGDASGIEDTEQFTAEVEVTVLFYIRWQAVHLVCTIMDQAPLPGSAGAKLKALRRRLRLTLRDVEPRSRNLAAEKQNPDYVVSRGWLNNIETKSFTQRIYMISASRCTESLA